jgi:hypothetical protein
MNQIELTMTSRGGVAVSNVKRVFDTSRMIGVEQKLTGTTFYYPDENNQPQLIIVSESYEAVKDLMDAASVGLGAKKQVVLLFDATGGKAIGTHALVDYATGAAFQLPTGAIITRSWYRVQTTFTSATDAATIALGVATDAAAGIKAAIAISNGANPYDAGNVEGISTGTVATMVAITTGARNINAVVAVEALTAGKLALVLEYTQF